MSGQYCSDWKINLKEGIWGSVQKRRPAQKETFCDQSRSILMDLVNEGPARVSSRISFFVPVSPSLRVPELKPLTQCQS